VQNCKSLQFSSKIARREGELTRKNLLAAITAHETTRSHQEARSEYAARGASRSMILSIEEMAENAKKMIAGEVIVSLDPNLLDGSFVSDRIEDDAADFALFCEGIEREGQLQPILVRPHPEVEGRYMIVFGHRRTRAARQLGRTVRAVIKNLEEVTHIIAQGQENSRRADLTFIEKALFAKKLLAMGQRRDTIKSALSVDDTLVSRMLAVVEAVPPSVIEAIGAARTVGRDRWEELKKLVIVPSNASLARQILQSEGFLTREGAARFDYLLAQLKLGRKAHRKAADKAPAGAWIADDQQVAANYRKTVKTFSLTLTSKDAAAFGQYISSSLDALYLAFKEAKSVNETGD
jgi:ParB family transcriptional regulator, chromosome partitioning protein